MTSECEPDRSSRGTAEVEAESNGEYSPLDNEIKEEFDPSEESSKLEGFLISGAGDEAEEDWVEPKAEYERGSLSFGEGREEFDSMTESCFSNSRCRVSSSTRVRAEAVMVRDSSFQ